MKSQLLLCVYCICLLVGSASAQNFVSSDGYQFEVTLKLQKDSVMLGEPTYMDFEVKNLSVVNLGVMVGGDYRNEYGRPESFEVDFFDSNGVLQPKRQLMTMGGLIGFQKAPVGGSFNVRLYLSHWANIQQPGKYKIVVKRQLTVRKYGSPLDTALSAKGGVQVNITSSINVVASDPEKMGEVVNAIGNKLVAGDETAEHLVPFIDDDRIIKFLTEAIKKNPVLTRHLAKFNDDRALRAIISRIDDKEQEVRRNVSVSLSLSVHPKSKLYLLGMRTDKNVGIRLDVVHYLGKTNTVESTRILKEMANDEDQKWIGSEARRYLKERGELVN